MSLVIFLGKKFFNDSLDNNENNNRKKKPSRKKSKQRDDTGSIDAMRYVVHGENQSFEMGIYQPQEKSKSKKKLSIYKRIVNKMTSK